MEGGGCLGFLVYLFSGSPCLIHPLLLYTIALATASLVRTPYPLLKIVSRVLLSSIEPGYRYATPPLSCTVYTVHWTLHQTGRIHQAQNITTTSLGWSKNTSSLEQAIKDDQKHAKCVGHDNRRWPDAWPRRKQPSWPPWPDSWQLEGEVARHVKEQLEVVALARQIFHSTICDLTMCGDMIFFTCWGKVSVVITLGRFFIFPHRVFFAQKRSAECFSPYK